MFIPLKPQSVSCKYVHRYKNVFAKWKCPCRFVNCTNRKNKHQSMSCNHVCGYKNVFAMWKCPSQPKTNIIVNTSTDSSSDHVWCVEGLQIEWRQQYSVPGLTRGEAECYMKPYQCQLLVLLIPYCTLNHAINYTYTSTISRKNQVSYLGRELNCWSLFYQGYFKPVEP